MSTSSDPDPATLPTGTGIVFDRVVVDFAMHGGARVSWRLSRRCTIPEPHTFLLQVGATGAATASDWEAVGSTFQDAFYAVDSERRAYGRNLTPHYRVVLIADGYAYYSEPQDAYGLLPFRDWVIAREIIRKELLLRDKFVGIEGVLLKRKWAGTTPDANVGVPAVGEEPVTDPLTGEIIHSGATATAGTEFVGGYYEPVPFLFALSQETHYSRRDDRGVLGSINPMQQKGRCPAFPSLNTEDVLVDIQSDRRYFVHAVEHAAQYRNVPLVVMCDLKLAESDNVIYNIEVNNVSSAIW